MADEDTNDSAARQLRELPPALLEALRNQLAAESAGGPKKDLPIEFEHADGDVVIRRLTAAEAATPEVQARVDQWGQRRVSRGATLGTVAEVSRVIAELEAESVAVPKRLAAYKPKGQDKDHDTARAADEERTVQIADLLRQRRAQLARIESEGEPFEILVPVTMLGDVEPERIEIQTQPRAQYHALVDSVSDGIARSLRPANEYGDVARVKRRVTVTLRANGAQPAEAKKTLRFE